MKTKRTIELTVERREFLVLPRSRRSVFGWCEVCAERVRMLTPEEAARRTGLSLRALYRRIETGGLHFLETPEGLLLICLDSLA